MMLRLRLKISSVCLVLTTVACAGVIAPRGPSNLTGTAHIIRIEGRLENESLRESVGSAVTAYRISADGRLMPLQSHASSTDQDGRYTVDAEVPNGEPVDLLVRADSEFGYGLVVVPTDMVVEKSVPAQPITDETTVEAQVYLAAKAAGTWPSHLGVSRLHGLISENLASGVLHEDDYAAAVGVLSCATSAAAASWGLVLTDPNVGVRQDQLKSVFAAVDWSLMTRDDVLTHAPDKATVQEAESDFEASGPLAYGLAKIEPMQLSLAAQATAESLSVYAKRLHGAAQAQALTDAALMRASYVTAMVNEALYQAGTLRERQVVQAAGDGLRKKLLGAAAHPEATEAALHAAWLRYQSEVNAVLREAATGVENIDFAAVQQAMQPSAQAAVDALGALKSDAQPQVTAAAAAQALAKLYAASEAQASALCAGAPSVQHDRVRALLAAVSNLAIAAR